MAYLKGELGMVKFSETGSSEAAVLGTKSWSVTVNKEILETTVQSKNYKEFIGGLISAEGSVTLVYDVDRTNNGKTHKFMKDITTADDPADADFEFYPDNANHDSRVISFGGIITSAEFGATLGETQEVTIGFISSGTITNDM